MPDLTAEPDPPVTSRPSITIPPEDVLGAISELVGRIRASVDPSPVGGVRPSWSTAGYELGSADVHPDGHTLPEHGATLLQMLSISHG